MKRSRHRGLGLSIFCYTLILVCLPSSSAVRATSLIFSKTSTTAAPEEVAVANDGDAPAETAEVEAPANTTSKLSGIPQIDYIYDPNLPRELNGYNLSEYPFYEAVPPPETMDFKCDGLHDGFYASVPHKCQVYHHCLFGTRYDFLCANYTAFDQKTFICHFVSEVDCKNSPNYFSRNEALYKAASSSTAPPPPSTTTTTTTTAPPRSTRRPPRRRPVYDDYYDEDDDYYERDYDYRGTKRRPRPRPGPRWRPSDDIDYSTFRHDRERNPEDSYPEDRPYRRPGKRPTYKQSDYEEERPSSGRNGYRRPIRPKRPIEEEDDRYVEDEDRRNGPRNDYRPREEKRRPKDDVMSKRPRDEVRSRDEQRDRDEIKPRDEIKSRDEIRPRDEVRIRGEGGRRDEVRSRDEIRPRDEIRSRDEIKPRDEIRSRDENRPRDEIRSRDEVRPRDNVRLNDDVRQRDEKRPRDEVRSIRPKEETKPRDEFRPREERRPSRDDLETKPFRARDERYNDGRRYREQDRRPLSRDRPKNDRYDDSDRVEEKQPKVVEVQPLVKPSGHGIFSQPRMPPKIKRPVPAAEKDKYGYVPVATSKAPPIKNDDYEYDYEEEEPSRPAPSGKTSTISQKPKHEPIVKEKFKPSRSHNSSPNPKVRPLKRPIDYEDDEEYYIDPKPQKFIYNQRNEKGKKPSDPDYYYDYEEKKKEERSNLRPSDEDVKDVKVNVKIIKRPFLPSRGGSPYLPRGLKPVAGKNLSLPTNTTPKPTTTTSTSTTTTLSTTTTKYTTTTTPPITTTIETTQPPTTTTKITTAVPKTTETYRTTTAQRYKTLYTTTELLTTEKPTTTEESEKENPTTTLSNSKKNEDEYEYYDEEDIDYDKQNKKVSTTPFEKLDDVPVNEKNVEISSESKDKYMEEDYYDDETEPSGITTKKQKAIFTETEQNLREVLNYHKVPTTTLEPELKTNRPSTTTDQITTTYKNIKYIQPIQDPIPPPTEDQAKKLASKVLKAYTDNYENVREKLKSTLTPNSYLKDYIGPQLKPKYIEPIYPNIEIQPEISTPYTATGKPLKISENISIKQNLADSIENEYDVRLNEAVSPSVRVPTGFVVPNDRDYTFSRFRNYQPEQQFAASELSSYQLRKHPQIAGVSIRTPSSYFLQPPQSLLHQGDYIRPARHLVYRGFMV